jgi:hypothetical protein
MLENVFKTTFLHSFTFFPFISVSPSGNDIFPCCEKRTNSCENFQTKKAL